VHRVQVHAHARTYTHTHTHTLHAPACMHSGPEPEHDQQGPVWVYPSEEMFFNAMKRKVRMRV